MSEDLNLYITVAFFVIIRLKNLCILCKAIQFEAPLKAKEGKIENAAILFVGGGQRLSEHARANPVHPSL